MGNAERGVNFLYKNVNGTFYDVAHQSADNKRCVTISLEMKFISAAKLGDKLVAKTVKVQKN